MTNSCKQDLRLEVNQIIADFDFVKVHKVMKALDWAWFNAGTEDGVPTVGQLMITAQGLINQALIELNYQDEYLVATGGFYARVKKYPDGFISISLQFVVASRENTD